MSIDLITLVRRRLDVSHGELLVAVELADAANDFGEGISVGVDRIADRSRQDPRTVQRQLKRLRDVGWLQIVEAGGMVGGRGKPTHYRINADWIKGDILPGFPDFVPQHYHREKGDKLSPLSSGQAVDSSDERVTNSTERVTKPPLKGDTALSPDPSTHIPSGGAQRAGEPSGPARHAQETKAEPERVDAKGNPFNAQMSRQTWFTFVHNAIVTGAIADGIAGYGTVRITDLPHQARVFLAPVLNELTEWAIAEERSGFPEFTAKSRKGVEEEIEARIRRELKPLRAPSPAERAA